MHRLVWKIFFWFWSALILFSLATLFITSQLIEGARSEDESTDTRTRIAEHVRAARAIGERQGRAALEQWLRALDRREMVPLYLVTDSGADLLGREVPQFVRERIERHAGHASMGMIPGPLRRFAVKVDGAGTLYLMPDFAGVTLGRVLGRPRIIAVPLVVGAVTSAIVCLLLARYLTAPITRLRRATEEIARGNLTHRVVPQLGARRDELAALARDFDAMSARLEALIASHRQLVNDVSHELRSPLARLQVALELARQHLSVGGTADLDRIGREADRLEVLVGDLLSLSRLEARTQPEYWESVDMSALLHDIVADASFEVQGQDRTVRLVDDAGGTVNGDIALLHSAIENIVRNAVRHTDPGTSVDVCLDRRDDQIFVRVQDSGPGVPEEFLDKIFNPFARVSGARERSSGGHGLGLAIAERAIRLHGGLIRAANRRPAGLEVLVQLPAATTSQ